MVDEEVRHKLLREIADLQLDFPLGPLHPLGAGGTADYYTVAKDTIELATAVKAAMDNHLPYVVIGQATSVLFSDGGFPGLVIHNQADRYVIANDRSQMVVDSGMPLQRFITNAAGQGFGGLTHLYQENGTVGGAVYANVSREGQAILSSVRNITLLMPPTKIKDATIVRYRGDWLVKSPQETKLQWLRTSQPEAYQPVILNVQFQLTSVRSDELIRRITREAAELERSQPSGKAFGPLFEEVPNTSLTELLIGARAHTLREENVYVDKRHPNFLRAKGNRPVRASAIVQLVARMQDQVRSQYAAELVPRFERLGAW